MAEKAQRAQAAAKNGRQKELYSIVKQLTGHNNRQVAAVKNKDAELLKNMEARKKRCKEHFQEVLNRDATEEEELDISTKPPTLQEIKTAQKTLNNGKAPGADQITVEMLREDPELTCIELKRIFDLIWEKETVPTQ